MASVPPVRGMARISNLKRVTNMGPWKIFVGRRRRRTRRIIVVSRTPKVVRGMPLIPNTSTHPASTRTSNPIGADRRVKANIRGIEIDNLLV